MRNTFLKLALATALFTGIVSSGGLVHAINCSTTAPTTTQQAIQCGTDNAAGVPGNTKPTSINTTIAHIINLISVAVGIAAVIMIIVGGFRYITSAGKEEGIKSAKNTILYALIGLIVVALAQVIVNFVLDKATTTCAETTPGSGIFRDSAGRAC